MTDIGTFKIDLAVRDYECDMQGIVNNANYQHYLEHARHEYLKEKGLDFATLTQDGIIVVVVRIELDFCKPLRSGDRFTVSVVPFRQSRLRLGFHQEIRHVETEETHLRGRVLTTAVNENGRPWFPEVLKGLLPSD
ncbi:thioesterase [Pseudohongiella nitratireducens]|jgi:acyl-CoA thioester hydrolase|uniref:Thioesterase n=1 Tax=Pseudohongiella nitratireducens TaxID=1768907 RepID=A0A917GQ65_9GAMM|nr:thioesterase family protein [Pseudohongiella nitratireducens]MDF1622840.1 thioesterase family protein [Pseudohongiella nitratireducens]GGG54016.1 thioesterase [Pseudohongiella nitratireducens]